ncbi:MAG: conjugal transfer protein TraX [Oscillospiraceae bacterium]|nr:conjugal transfer protein TraX [Oscillospiraceae bacterium]
MKWIALIAMTLAHIEVVIGQWVIIPLWQDNLAISMWIMRSLTIIGRLAFPLFAFLIAEGCRNTKSMLRYIGRLLLFAVISQPFFYIANYYPDLTASSAAEGVSRAFRSVLRLRLTNVMTTLTLGACCIFAFQKLRTSKYSGQKWIIILIVLIACILAAVIKTDYSWFGVALIFGLYIVKNKTVRFALVTSWSFAAYMIIAAYNGTTLTWIRSGASAVEHALLFAASCSSVILMNNYTSVRHKKTKWFFYIYYPAHFIILVLVNTALRKVLD